MLDDKKMRVAIYCRLAHEDEDGMELQLQSMRNFAKNMGFTDCMEYIDNGASGISADRPALVRMNEDILLGCIQVILIWDMSRLFRGFHSFLDWKKNVRIYGVTVISAQDGELDDMLLPLCLMQENAPGA